MAASLRAGKPAASGHQSPTDATTGARAAQSKGEDAVDDQATTERALEKEEEVEKAEPQARAPADFNTSFSAVNEQTHVGPEDFVDSLDFSEIRHSNEEYFRKLEELKTAHMETMAKLEKMYQNKLNLKGVQPVVIREETSGISSRSVSEKNSYHPVSLVTSFSEPNLSQSSSLIMLPSEDELPNLEKEYPKKNKVMNYAKELINNMWTNFSVEDYIQCKDVDDLPAVEKAKKKPKEWVPKITVPEPFQMTIREQKKKEEDMKSKSDLEMLHNALEKEEDSECKKKFRANPVPTFVFFPSYHDLLQQNEEQRRFRKEKNKEALLASQKPFKFIAREEQKQAIREKQLRDFFKCKKTRKRFKAKPIPQSTYALTTNGKLKDKLCGNTRTQELLQNSSPLSDTLAYKNFATWKPKYPEQTEKLRGKHKASCVSTKKEKNLADIETDEEENLKETHWPYLSPRHKSPVGSASAKPMPCDFYFPMPTASSRGREQATRKSLEEKKMLEEERNRILTKQKQRMKELQKLLINRAKAYDSHQSLAQMSKARVKSLRKSEKERMREYQQELEEREEKLKNRPLLFERVAQKNARMAAEKHYFNTLKALGISDEFVSKKGQSGKTFEYFSNQEKKSFTGDKESLNDEEKIKETENGEENYLSDTNSQDSCKEKDEADEESGEEKLVEK
ncbi:protein FAM161A isoform X2 [Talpa occidentalis]|uniref:protein FAM161A isoform X2 n=1 Tax=Talpa occidentalis TaxID=50954 RepID=UPI0023F8F438|nr:protein FAM161A isoform X2 [Talpa occidentalis]